MLIRHAAYFQLLPVLDHPVSVIRTTLVAALVPIVGLALGAPPTRRLLAVGLPAIAVVADDERLAAPPTFDLSSVCAHRLTRGERRKFGRSNEPCDLSSRIVCCIDHVGWDIEGEIRAVFDAHLLPRRRPIKKSETRKDEEYGVADRLGKSIRENIVHVSRICSDCGRERSRGVRRRRPYSRRAFRSRAAASSFEFRPLGRRTALCLGLHLSWSRRTVRMTELARG